LGAAAFQQRRALFGCQWLPFAKDDCPLVILDIQSVAGLELGITAQFGRQGDLTILSQDRIHDQNLESAKL
jgi:hypothetical protein